MIPLILSLWILFLSPPSSAPTKMQLPLICILTVIIASGSQAQQPFPFFPGFHVQGWPQMPAFVPQGFPPQQPPQGQPPMWGPGPPRPGFPPGRPMPRPAEPNPNPDVDEPESRNHPNPGPSGPEHESEADIIPAKPDDGSGGGPTSATPGRPLIGPGGFGRLSGALHHVPVAFAVASSQNGGVVPVVSYVTTNVVPRAIPGAIPASPLVPAGHSVVYYDEVSHSGSEPKDQKDQRPDESQVHELVQSPDEQQSQERPAIPVPAAPLPALLPESPVAASPVEPAAESSGEEQPAADSYDTEDGAGNDQPAVAVPEEEPVDGPPVPQEMRRRVVESKIRETPQTQDQGQEEDVPQVPQVPPQQEVKGVKRPQYPAKGGVKGQRPIVTPHPLPPARRRPVVPEQSIKGQAPLPEAAPVPHLPKHGSKGGRRRVPVVPAVDEAPLPQVPQVPQAVRGGVKGGQQQQEAKGQRPVQVPEQSVKGQAPVQVPADESPEALAPAAKGGRRRIQVLPQVPVAEEEEVPQAPQQAVKGVKGGQQQQEETKGHDHPHPAKRIPRPQRGGVKGGQQQQQEEVQDQAVKG